MLPAQPTGEHRRALLFAERTVVDIRLKLRIVGGDQNQPLFPRPLFQRQQRIDRLFAVGIAPGPNTASVG